MEYYPNIIVSVLYGVLGVLGWTAGLVILGLIWDNLIRPNLPR